MLESQDPVAPASTRDPSCWRFCRDRDLSPSREPLLGGIKRSRDTDEEASASPTFAPVWRVLLWKRHLLLYFIGIFTFIKRPIVTSFSDKRYLQARIANPSNWYQLEPIDAGLNSTSKSRWIYSLNFNSAGNVTNDNFFQPDLGWDWTKELVGYDLHDRHYFLEWLWNVHVLGSGVLFLLVLTWRTRKPGRPCYLAAINMIRRVVWVYMLALNLRDMCYPVTTLAVYPPTYSEYTQPNFDDFWSAAWKRMFDFAGESYTDCIYSGHSAIMTILACASVHRVKQLRFPTWMNVCICGYYILFALFAYFILLLKQMHYSVDVGVALIISVAIYTNKVWDYAIFRDLKAQDCLTADPEVTEPASRPGGQAPFTLN